MKPSTQRTQCTSFNVTFIKDNLNSTDVLSTWKKMYIARASNHTNVNDTSHQSLKSRRGRDDSERAALQSANDHTDTRTNCDICIRVIDHTHSVSATNFNVEVVLKE